MKRALILLAVLATPAFAAEKFVSFKLRHALDSAVQNERQAVARYEAYAQKATDEGYAGAANLFHAAARAEQIHAQRFEAAIRSRGLEIPATTPGKFDVGSTADNLRAASAAETSERDTVYRDAINAAREDHEDALATLFDQTRDTEVEHANLFAAASRNLGKMKAPKAYFVCDRCGYTTDIDLPLCALCRNDEHPHRVE